MKVQNKQGSNAILSPKTFREECFNIYSESFRCHNNTFENIYPTNINGKPRKVIV
jgi:hypothetical protein